MPGKFDSERDERIYGLTLDAWQSDEFGSVQEDGWFALILDVDNHDFIVHEDSQGFVSVTEFAPGDGREAFDTLYDMYSVQPDDFPYELEYSEG